MVLGALLVAISMSSFANSLEAEEAIAKIRTRQPWVRFSSDYVRCFCNLPQCISTGYMCKSAEGGCFSNFSDRMDSKDYHGRHGCLEFLGNKANRASCTTPPTEAPLHRPTFCCHHDMCNHVDSPQTRDLLNDSALSGAPFPGPRPLDYTDSQVWFRAATIAVPVCGALILFLLIALAVRMLRSEGRSSSSRKLGVEVKRTQAPLLVRKGREGFCGFKDGNVLLDVEKIAMERSKSCVNDGRFVGVKCDGFVGVKCDGGS